MRVKRIVGVSKYEKRVKNVGTNRNFIDVIALQNWAHNFIITRKCQNLNHFPANVNRMSDVPK